MKEIPKKVDIERGGLYAAAMNINRLCGGVARKDGGGLHYRLVASSVRWQRELGNSSTQKLAASIGF